MRRYEYKVVPAPQKGLKERGVRSAEGRFAFAVETTLNDMGAEGWEYLRAELLPSEERSGLTGSVTNWRNVLVFRRALDGTMSETAADDRPAPDPEPDPDDADDTRRGPALPPEPLGQPQMTAGEGVVPPAVSASPAPEPPLRAVRDATADDAGRGNGDAAGNGDSARR
ncbi:DUF4177 domain-containing protein [Pukyongiella litopenaei]|uniref:DUF4177 domain-containing protein n=1 Tax=Pukyongiella litopenaei TaxID=2605946 RepID=UPI001FCE9133|nr:DUF4177 domain-containing protein [Pukyongiella litopenaei]